MPDNAAGLAWAARPVPGQVHNTNSTGPAPDKSDGPQLQLEPDSYPAVPPYKGAHVYDGIPAASFAVTDVGTEHSRLQGLGVNFRQESLNLGTGVTAVFDDACGHLIQLAAPK